MTLKDWASRTSAAGTERGDLIAHVNVLINQAQRQNRGVASSNSSPPRTISGATHRHSQASRPQAGQKKGFISVEGTH